MGKIQLSFLLFFCALFSFAQTTITGQVKKSSGEPIASASVTLEESGKDAILAYGITDAKGNYKLTFNSQGESFDLKVKAFNYSSATKSVANQTQTQNFTLSSESTEIQEVIIKTRLITKKGDTISYDLNSFDQKNDRTLADVLKRMPGIEVNKDGSILYQGQPLSKFYVEGKDLMEGGYGVINNSLPKGAVAKVEVMENHQPVKILQGKIPTEQAALNIRLKNKVTMTGRGEIGLGIADPGLWNIKLTPMFLSKGTQWLVNYKTNNMGEQVEQEGNMFAFGTRFEGRRSNASQNVWLSTETASRPALPERRWLMNNVHFASANVLLNPFKDKEWELKANASYTNNAVERESVVERCLKSNNTVSQNGIANNFYTNKAKGELIFTKNAKKGFFKNATTFTQFWNADRANAYFNNTTLGITGNNAQQTLESPTVSFQNSLSAIVPFKEKMLNVMSYVSYQKDTQDLTVTPGGYVLNGLPAFGNLPGIRQNFNSKTLEANHSLTMGFNIKSWTLTPEVGFNYTNSKINSDIFGLDGALLSPAGENWRNRLNYEEAMAYGAVGINYKSEALSLNMSLPANFYSIHAQDETIAYDKKFSKTAFEPNLFAQYSFASFWKASVTAGMGYNFADASRLYTGGILQSPLSARANDPNNPVYQTNSRRAGARLEYRNPLNNLFFNGSYGYNYNKSNLIANPLDQNLGYSVVNYIVQDNVSNSNTEAAEIGKYFPKLKSNAALSFRNTLTVSDNYLNGTYFQNRNTNQSLGLKLSNAYFSWFNLDYNFTLTWMKNRSLNTATNNRSYVHAFTGTIFPAEGHSVALNWDQVNTHQNQQDFRNGFFDLIYQFAWTARKIDFELKWQNIANKKVFETINDTTLYTTISRINIRPSQVLFTVKFNFK